MKLRVMGFLVVLICLTTTPAFAQNFSAGVKAGVNFSKISFDPEQEFCCDNKTGFIGGLFVTAPINDVVSIQPEFLYSMIGTKSEFEGFESEIDVRVFQLPILVRADFSGATVRPFVLAGPSFGFKLSAKEKFDGDEEDLEDVESVDVGFTIGGGVQFGAGSVEVRYTHGLRNLNKTSDEDGFEAKTRVFAVLAGFRFGS